MLIRTLSFCAVTALAITFASTPSFAASTCPEAKNASERAIKLEVRNKFLDTKFARSDSAPASHREEARAARVACRKA